MKTIQPALDELYRIYAATAKMFGLDPKDPPLILIASRGRRKNWLGWHQAKAWRNKKDVITEVCICAEVLDRGPLKCAETLLHEMVHLANSRRGINDCSVNQYHNASFRNMAVEAGMICEKMEKFGWASTSLGPEQKKVLKSMRLKRAAFQLARREFEAKEKPPTKMRKWACQCGINIRAAVELDITCNRCGELFEKKG